MTEQYCVIGDPIEHSLSPPIHNLVFQSLGVTETYGKVHILPDDLATFMETCRETGRPGFNVTIPHKETIIPLLDEIDTAAQNIGAVNTVVNQNGCFIGFNTDVHGFRKALQRSGFESGHKAMILGSGGAARAGIEALASMGLQKIVLFDLIPERPQVLCDHFSKLHQIQLIDIAGDASKIEQHLPEIDLLVNATPVGMWPNTNRSPLSCPNLFPENATVFDLVYNPLQTKLMQDLKSRNARTISGLAMLVEQALAADALYLKRDIPDALFEKVFDFVNEQMGLK